MIARSIIEEQIRRMGGLDGYPAFEPGGYAELVRIAGKFSRSESHLSAVMDEIMETMTKCPKPAELRALLDLGRPEPVVHRDCANCGGSGWMIVANGGAARCPCGSRPLPPSADAPYDKREKPARLKDFIQ